MEQRLYIGFQKIENSKTYKVLTAILFPVLIVVMAMLKVNKGLDITDSSYSPLNFAYADKLDGMWYFSTFYANLLGSILIKLPMGNTMLGMNIYTGLIKVILGLAAYYFFTCTVKIQKELVFLGEFAAIALCWCPSTILYNYLSYLFFFLGAMFLYRGITEEKKIHFILAGFFLGSNLFVRLPNVVETALILALWYYAMLKREKFGSVVSKTLYCILGYVIGLVPGMGAIFATRGMKEYVKGIEELFAMSSDASGYSVKEMIYNTVMAYVSNWTWDEIVFFMLVLCLLSFLVFPTKLTLVRYLSASLVCVIFVYLLYKKDMFCADLHYHAAGYRTVATVLSVAVVWMIGILISRKSSDKEKLLSVMSLLVIAITPLGTNNEIYSNMNNLFFVLPVFLWLIVHYVESNEHFRGIRYGILLLFGVSFIYWTVTGSIAVFRDGETGPMNYRVENNAVVANMYTTEDNAKMLTELSDLWAERNYSEGRAVYYGNVSGLGFYLNTMPAISTAWPSLASFSEEKFECDMKELDAFIREKGMNKPVVVIGEEELKNIFSDAAKGKGAILKKFLEENNYEKVYSNERLTVYE